MKECITKLKCRVSEDDFKKKAAVFSVVFIAAFSLIRIVATVLLVLFEDCAWFAYILPFTIETLPTLTVIAAYGGFAKWAVWMLAVLIVLIAAAWIALPLVCIFRRKKSNNRLITSIALIALTVSDMLCALLSGFTSQNVALYVGIGLAVCAVCAACLWIGRKGAACRA